MKNNRFISFRFAASSDVNISRPTECVSRVGVTNEASNGSRILDNDEIRLRDAKPNDSRWVWRLTNLPDVRSASFDSKPIPWEIHRSWYADRLADQNYRFYIFESANGRRIGQTRFAINNDEAVVSISVLPIFRGRGYGKAMIKMATAALFADHKGIQSILAYIKFDNRHSINTFSKSGFICNNRNGSSYIILELKRGTI